MYVNNPKDTMCMLDLLNMYAPDFSYENLYDVVGEWLSTEKKYFFTDNDDIWKRFIEYFCDSFYSRNINFYTWGDFKIRLRKTLRDCEDNARHIYKSSLLEINPLQTYENVVKRTGKDTSNRIDKGTSSSNAQSTAHSSDSSNSSGSGSNTDKAYNLHSDTPSDAVNIDDLFSVAKNYVTDAQNTKSSGTSSSTSQSSGTSDRTDTSSSSGTTTSTSENENNSIVDELAKGWTGSQVELIDAYNRLNLDVCKFYCEQIEEACLFSSVLY